MSTNAIGLDDATKKVLGDALDKVLRRDVTEKDVLDFVEAYMAQRFEETPAAVAASARRRGLNEHEVRTLSEMAARGQHVDLNVYLANKRAMEPKSTAGKKVHTGAPTAITTGLVDRRLSESAPTPCAHDGERVRAANAKGRLTSYCRQCGVVVAA